VVNGCLTPQQVNHNRANARSEQREKNTPAESRGAES